MFDTSSHLGQIIRPARLRRHQVFPLFRAPRRHGLPLLRLPHHPHPALPGGHGDHLPRAENTAGRDQEDGEFSIYYYYLLLFLNYNFLQESRARDHHSHIAVVSYFLHNANRAYNYYYAFDRRADAFQLLITVLNGNRRDHRR